MVAAPRVGVLLRLPPLGRRRLRRLRRRRVRLRRGRLPPYYRGRRFLRRQTARLAAREEVEQAGGLDVLAVEGWLGQHNGRQRHRRGAAHHRHVPRRACFGAWAWARGQQRGLAWASPHRVPVRVARGFSSFDRDLPKIAHWRHVASCTNVPPFSVGRKYPRRQLYFYVLSRSRLNLSLQKSLSESSHKIHSRDPSGRCERATLTRAGWSPAAGD